MVQTCCVKKCNSRSHDRFRKKNEGLRFFSFPAWKKSQEPKVSEITKARRMAWIAAVRHPKITFDAITPHMLVCSRHFQTGKPAYEMNRTHPDWAPSLHLGHTEVKAADNTHKWERRQENVAAVHSASATPAPPAQHVTDNGETGVALQLLGVDEGPGQNYTAENPQRISCNGLDGGMKSMHGELDCLLEEKELSATKMDKGFFNEDDEKVEYYTGLPYWTLLQALHTVLIPCLTKAGRKLSPFQMLLLTLMRLRLNLTQQRLAYLFQISHTEVSEMFRETIDALHFHLAPLVHWPARHCLQYTMPHKFLETFGSRVAVILNCFEIVTEKPSNLKAQAQTSQYKQKHTVKYLIGVTPQGSISFISKGWGGCVSDKQLTEQCGILDKLLPGDLVLANHGFNIGDEVGLMCAEVKTPDFTGGHVQIDPKSVEETRQIAHLRVHVEKVNGLICNKYDILQHDIPTSLLDPLEGKEFNFIDSIVTVCCALTNMCPSVVMKYQSPVIPDSDEDTV